MNLEEMKINLRTLWTEDYSKLPDWVDSENVIYKIENLINGKVYIGQARWFYGRFVGNGFSHINTLKSYCISNKCNSRIYSAFRKYHSRNFEISIVELCKSVDDLNPREVYWISYYNSYNKGYNLTTGGDNCENLHTPETVARQIQSLYDKYGDLPINLPDAVKKRLDKNASHYNGDCMGQCHTKEAFDNNRRNHGGVLAWSTPESTRKARITKLFKSINYAIDDIKKWHPDFKEITGDIYWHHMPYEGANGINHTIRILGLLEYMRQDPRWTPEMENIFGYIEIHREEYGI